jgi:two-component system heavy metal sensor histidine kinase CusS
MNRRRQSITFRITLLFATVATAVLLALGLMIGNAVEQHFIEQDMEVLTGKTHLVAHLLEQMQSPTDLTSLPRALEDSLVGHHDLAVMVIGADGNPVFTTPNAQFTDALLKSTEPRAQPQPEPHSWTQAGRPWRGFATRLPSGQRKMPPLLVAVAVDISHHERFMDSFRRTLWLLVAVAAALLALLGGVVVRRELQPLQAMRNGAAGVTANRLDYRLSMDAVPIEFAELAETLNEMLARLEESFQRLKDFSSDLAHELRTPISNLMTETQVALTRARSTDEYREVLASNAEEYERLARMIGDMLFLAQADNGLLVPNREPVELAAQVRDLFDFFDALAEEKNLHLTLSGSGQVVGDKLMLRRALANLISNAIRHTPSGGRIGVCIAASASGTKLSIENSGAPIPQEHLPRIFDRFYRADPSRHGSSEGAGLGLAITRSIIRAHDGEIVARSGTDSVCFEMQMT